MSPDQPSPASSTLPVELINGEAGVFHEILAAAVIHGDFSIAKDMGQGACSTNPFFATCCLDNHKFFQGGFAGMAVDAAVGIDAGCTEKCQ